MSTSVVLRDVTASSDLISESYTDPVVNPPTQGWEGDQYLDAIARRMMGLKLQAELYVLGGSTHTYQVKRNGASLYTIAPFTPDYSGTWTLYDVNLGSTVVTWTGAADRAMTALTLEAEVLRAGGTLHVFQVRQDATVRRTIP